MTQNEREGAGAAGAERRIWEPMRVTYAGHLATVMQTKPGTRGDGQQPLRTQTG